MRGVLDVHNPHYPIRFQQQVGNSQNVGCFSRIRKVRSSSAIGESCLFGFNNNLVGPESSKRAEKKQMRHPNHPNLSVSEYYPVHISNFCP